MAKPVGPYLMFKNLCCTHKCTGSGKYSQPPGEGGRGRFHPDTTRRQNVKSKKTPMKKVKM
jgi:hypothetical protein